MVSYTTPEGYYQVRITPEMNDFTRDPIKKYNARKKKEWEDSQVKKEVSKVVYSFRLSKNLRIAAQFTWNFSTSNRH
jgi:hypothetical protein